MSMAVTRELAKRKKKTETQAPLLVSQCAALRLPIPVLEYYFHPTRRWRFDLAWPDYRLAVEIDGGGWVNGRHSRGAGIEDDAEKLAEAVLKGWRVFRSSPRQVKTGTVVTWLERAFLLLPTPQPHTAGVPHVR